MGQGLMLYMLHAERMSSVKYLGVELAERLHWNKPIHAVTTEANKAGAFIYRNLKGCPADPGSFVADEDWGEG